MEARLAHTDLEFDAPAAAQHAPRPAPVDAPGDGHKILGSVPGLMLHRIREGMAAPHSYVLWLRFSLINAVAFALVGAAWTQGWVDTVLAADNTGLTYIICATFLGGLTLAAHKVFRISRELNFAKQYNPPAYSKAARYLELVAGRGADSRAICASTLKLKLASGVVGVRNVGNSLVVLGLIGTVIGFIIALSGVNPEAVADVKAVAPMVSTLIQGMSVALYTTLVGSVLNIWLMINYHLLAGGTAKLITTIIEAGESHAGA